MVKPGDMHTQRQEQAGNGLLRMPERMIRALVKWHKQRRMLQELMAMDEHLLKDIGFRQDEVIKALSEGGMPERSGWTSKKPCKAALEGWTRCPFCGVLAAGRPAPCETAGAARPLG